MWDESWCKTQIWVGEGESTFNIDSASKVCRRCVIPSVRKSSRMQEILVCKDGFCFDERNFMFSYIRNISKTTKLEFLESSLRPTCSF